MRPRALGAAFITRSPEAETIATVERALELGIDYFDTYPGHSEERWGKALAGVERSSFYLQAKVGPLIDQSVAQNHHAPGQEARRRLILASVIGMGLPTSGPSSRRSSG